MQVVWHSWTQTHTMVTLKKKGKIHLNRNTTIQLVQRGAKKRKPNWEEICFQTADKSGLTGSSGCEGAPEYEQRHRLQLIKAGRWWICVVLCVPSLLSNVVKRMPGVRAVHADTSCRDPGMWYLIAIWGTLTPWWLTEKVQNDNSGKKRWSVGATAGSSTCLEISTNFWRQKGWWPHIWHLQARAVFIIVWHSIYDMNVWIIL